MNRRSFLWTLAGATALGGLPGAAWAIGEGSRLRLAVLEYEGGDWNARPRGLRKMLQEVEKRTSVSIDPAAASVRASNKAELFRYPLLFWTGTGDFPPLSQAEVENLALFLRAGGTLMIDSAQATRGGSFEAAARRELARILPGARLQAIPSSHVLYKSFYLIERPYGRVAISPRMEAIFGEDRAMVLLSVNDLMGAWSRDNFGSWDFDVFPGGPRQREMALRLGVNLVMYALCLNYKEDQVHVPFILRRRQWKVDP
jgi:hypothetical protein